MAKPAAKRSPPANESGEAVADTAPAGQSKSALKAARPHDRKTAPREPGPVPPVERSIEDAVGVTVDELTALYILDGSATPAPCS